MPGNSRVPCDTHRHIFSLKARFRNSCGKCMPSSRFSGFLQVLISQASRMRRLRHAFAARISKSCLEGQNLTIDPNLAHYKKRVFCELFFHLPLKKVEGSTETLGLKKHCTYFYTILTRVTFFIFLVCLYHLVTGPFLKPHKSFHTQLVIDAREHNKGIQFIFFLD